MDHRLSSSPRLYEKKIQQWYHFADGKADLSIDAHN